MTQGAVIGYSKEVFDPVLDPNRAVDYLYTFLNEHGLTKKDIKDEAAFFFLLFLDFKLQGGAGKLFYPYEVGETICLLEAHMSDFCSWKYSFTEDNIRWTFKNEGTTHNQEERFVRAVWASGKKRFSDFFKEF